ncbi:SAM-dependent methyltransferase [Niabella soli]|uniref:O-methyltransferase n=1 Tax=Niabella soli DSM 19437 TaxID=929713 RepID=W0EYL0_9BACT|nr:class I SAM-dependent methyltransferase [Niabella soli]AHF15905.1 O-methyltransferase [Niabella soli DSM 19437]
MIDFYKKEHLSAMQAKHMAQVIAHGPIVFQVARVLRDKNILSVIDAAHKEGIVLTAICEKTGVPEYGARVLLEAALGMQLVKYTDDEKFVLTKTGYFILHDPLTNVNMSFVQDICYKGMFHLEESVNTGKPEGLKELGNWNTVYEGLSQLNPRQQKSWFEYDHFFSDIAFPLVLKHIYKPENHIKRLLEIGGNTGKWALASTAFDRDVHITIMDLPGQADMAKENIEKLGLSDRVDFYPANVLEASVVFPTGYDGVWMSQFLDCFSEDEIVSILQRCGQALNADGSVYILEAFWDNQRFETSAFCIQQLSIYFTAIANGNSQMYDSRVFKKCIAKAGFEIVEEISGIGLSHTLLKCKKKS